MFTLKYFNKYFFPQAAQFKDGDFSYEFKCIFLKDLK